MTRYEDLATLAEKFSQAIDQHESKCREFALAIVNGYQQFLGCTTTVFRRVKLNQDLNPIGDTSPFDPHFPLIQHTDGFWYFAFQLTMKNPQAWYFGLTTVTVGVNYINQQYVIRCDEDFHVLTVDAAGLSDFFVSLYEESKERFSAPLHTAPRGIGFINK